MVTCREGDHDGPELSLGSACARELLPTVENLVGAGLVPSSLRFASALQRARGKDRSTMSLFQDETSFFCHRILMVLHALMLARG